MRTPMVVPTTGKHLDALLSWASVQEADFFGDLDPIAKQHDLGIAKHHVGDQWCFMASQVSYEWKGESSQLHYIKRSRLEDYVAAWDSGLLRKRPYFDGQRGSTKAGSYLQPLRWAETVTGFAIVEDMQRFEQLLQWVTHIGKLGHKDHGAVRSFTVDQDESATGHWVKRNLPVGSEFAAGLPLTVGGLVSPYWKRENHLAIAVGAA